MLKSKQLIVRTDLFGFLIVRFIRSFGFRQNANNAEIRIVRISDDIFCPKSKQIVWISALLSVRTKSSTEQRGSVPNPNTFGFQHSTVHNSNSNSYSCCLNLVPFESAVRRLADASARPPKTGSSCLDPTVGSFSKTALTLGTRRCEVCLNDGQHSSQMCCPATLHCAR